MTAKAVALLLHIASNGKDTDSGLPHLFLTVLLSAFLGVFLCAAVIIYILTSPFEFAGELGEFQLAYSHLVSGTAGEAIGQGGLTDEEIEALLTMVDTQDPLRRKVIQEALSLVGRVPYFWGGKSAPGWNDDWGTSKLVSAPGSASSGTYRPYGLDCSGYTNWAFQTAGLPSIGDGTYNQYWSCSDISFDELIPGDLVFKSLPSSPGTNHVGIYFGISPNTGTPLYLHCTSGSGVVLNGYSGFRYPRRPNLFNDTSTSTMRAMP